MSLTIMRRIKFCAGHRLHQHGGKCEHFHGHNYVADFFVQGTGQDAVGRVVDFAELKAKCKGWIDEHWDHSFLVFEEDENAIQALRLVKPCRLFLLPYNPTAENMAKYLLEEVSPTFFPQGEGRVVRVRIWETDESYAEASLDDMDTSLAAAFEATSTDNYTG
jgi:6-pyruvoyltetrahydropterin/6-carboxytetrahydropterin synthase